MTRPIKISFIVLLLAISISASIFMIVESGSFFQNLYQSKNSIGFMGYWAAFLNEVFMGIMAAVWLPKNNDPRKEKSHPINYFFKALLVFLFVTTVCGASLKTVFPLMDQIQSQRNQNSVIDLLETQVKDNEQSLNAFVQQNQRVNSALAVKNQIKVKSELKKLIADRQSTFQLWFEVFVIVLLRFGVQLSNLSCIWLAGWVYRQPAIGKQPVDVKREERVQTSLNENRILHPVNTQFDRTTVKNKSAISKKPVVSRNPNPTENIKPKINPKPKSSQSPILMQENESLTELREKITRLLKSRNEGISLAQIGKAIGEKESNLREIANPKARIENGSRPALESILLKIERLYSEEHVRSI